MELFKERSLKKNKLFTKINIYFDDTIDITDGISYYFETIFEEKYQNDFEQKLNKENENNENISLAQVRKNINRKLTEAKEEWVRQKIESITEQDVMNYLESTYSSKEQLISSIIEDELIKDSSFNISVDIPAQLEDSRLEEVAQEEVRSDLDSNIRVDAREMELEEERESLFSFLMKAVSNEDRERLEQDRLTVNSVFEKIQQNG